MTQHRNTPCEPRRFPCLQQACNQRGGDSVATDFELVWRDAWSVGLDSKADETSFTGRWVTGSCGSNWVKRAPVQLLSYINANRGNTLTPLPLAALARAARSPAPAAAPTVRARPSRSSCRGWHLHGQRRWNRRLWRRLARAPEAVAGRPVRWPLPGSTELLSVDRCILRKRRNRAGALPMRAL